MHRLRQWIGWLLLGKCLLSGTLCLGEDVFGKVRGPRLFYELDGSLLIGAQNGLFLAKDPERIESLGTEHSVNEIQPDHGGYLIATDGGLYFCRPDLSSDRLNRLGIYARSVRQLYPYADREYFVATQDGLKYLFNGVFRNLGKNVEVDALPGKYGDSVIGLCGSEFLLATGEFVDFHPCEGVISGYAATEEGLFVSTDSGLTVYRDGNLTVASEQAVADLAVWESGLLMATPRGLLHWSKGQAGNERVLTPGAYSDLEPFDGGVLAVGSAQCVLLEANKNPQVLTFLPGSRKCNKTRVINGELWFCLNNGLLRVNAERSQQTYYPSSSQVRDVVLFQGRLLLATDEGLKYFADSSWRSTLIPVGVLSAVICLAVLGLWLWRRSKPAVTIFCSYRRSDSMDTAGRLRDHLCAAFGDASVRMDVHSIEKGEDFRREIDRNLVDSDVVLVVIGQEWLCSRLFNEVDYVRYEIEFAFELGRKMIPVLLGDTKMPASADLPPSISKLSYLESMKLRADPDFGHDAAAIVAAIKRGLVKSGKGKKTAG